MFASDHSDIRKVHKQRDDYPGLLDETFGENEATDRELTAQYENVPGIVFYVSVEPDGDFRFRSMSKAGLAAMGLAREAVVNSLVRDVIPLPSRELVLNKYREAIRSGQTVRWREESVYPAGRKIGEVAVTPLFGANGIATHLIGIVHDITEREQLEELLQKQRDEEHDHTLKLLLETSTQGIVSVDANGRIVTANLALERMFGWPRAELIGKSIELLVPSALRGSHVQHRVNYFAAPRARLMGGGFTLVGERRDSSRFPIEVSLNHVSSPVGELAFAFISDVSERKRMEEALSNVSEKLIRAQEQERSRIGRELHDDISQRLALLSIALRELEDDPSDAPNRVMALRKGLGEISQDVQALSHELHCSKLEYLGVVDGMKSWCKEFGDWQKIEILFESDVSRALPFEVGLCLFRILQEALHNAAKHSTAKRIEVELSEDSGAIYLAVNDSGKGFDISAATLGRGVGLTSMRERVRLLNGSIAIESKPKGGTTIHVRVPLRNESGSQRAVG